MTETSPPSARTRVRRVPDRARYDRDVVDAILDAGMICHVGFTSEYGPAVLPTIYVRVADTVYLHGSRASAMLRAVRDGAGLCLSVTLLDGLVLARSALHHSMNYRSVVVYGRAREVTDEDEKRLALRAVVDHVVPGRSAEARPPSDTELRHTLVVALAVDESSAKVRTGPPKDEPEDHELPVWAGELPLRLVPGPPVPDPELPADVPAPPNVREYSRPG